MNTPPDRPAGMRGEVIAPPPSSSKARKLWLDARKSGLGASEAAVILGLSPFEDETPLKVWLSKTDPEWSDEEASEAMKWGLRLERPIADEFRVRHAKDLGIRVASSPGLLRHEDIPWLIATPDRIAVSLETAEAIGCIEIKAPGYHMSEKHWRDGVPLWYVVQVQVQMEVTGLDRAWVVALFGGQRMPEPYIVEKDPEAIAYIVERCGQWWEEHVIARVPPPPLVQDLSVLPDVWPGGAGAVELDEWAARKAAQRKRISRRITQLSEARDRIDLDLKVKMGDADAALDPYGRPLAKWTRFNRSKVHLDKMRAAHPELVAKYTTKEPAQRFSVQADEE